MIQQIIAIGIIVFFLLRLLFQKKKNNISGTEFFLWQFFWIFSILVIVFIKQIDYLVALLGFSSAGIDVLLYLSIVIMFYLLFKIRIKMEKMEKEITILVKKIAINDKK